MREAIEHVLAQLLASSREGDSISIDAIGDAVGTLAIAPDEIDALFVALENERRVIVAPEGARGEANLKRVLVAARAFKLEKKKSPSIADLALNTGLCEEDVRFALALAKVMQR